MRPVTMRPEIGIGLENRAEHAERSVLDGGRRDMPDHQIEQRRHAQVLRAFGRRRHPALLGRAVEDREIELLLAGVERRKQVEDFVDHRRRPRVRPVDLVDDDNGLEADLERLRHHEFGLRQRPFGGVDQHQRAVHHVEDALHLAAEIGMAGRVDDVDAGVVPEDRGHLGQDGDAALALEIVGIHRALGHPLVLAEGAGLLQQPVDQGGLAMIDMGDDGDVAQLHDCVKKPIAGRKGPLCARNIVSGPKDAMRYLAVPRGSPCVRGARKATMGTSDRRSRARADPSQE